VYVLDTDIVSNLRKQRPHPALLRWIEQTGWQEIATTVFTIMEIQMGIERARQSDTTVATRVEAWLAGLLQVGQPQVLPLNTEAALLLGRINETPALRNFLLPPPDTKKTKTGADLAIAALAIVHQAVVTTANSDDFLLIHQYFPLPGLYNPFQDKWSVGSAP
jgi:predicted nucleic acid-binding protein